jgi:hypothetical protein
MLNSAIKSTSSLIEIMPNQQTVATFGSNGLFVGGAQSSTSALSVNGVCSYSFDRYPIAGQGEEYTLGANGIVLADTTSSNLTLTLPAPTQARGEVFQIKKTINSNHVKVKTSDMNSKIDDNQTHLFLSSDNRYVNLFSDGTKWHTLSNLTYDETLISSDNLISYWDMDAADNDQITDRISSAKSISGFVVHSDNLDDGKRGNAILFNSINETFKINDPTSQLEENTISFWLKRTSDDNNKYSDVIYSAKSSNDEKRIRIIMNQIDNKVFMKSTPFFGGKATNGNVLPVNVWRHYAFVSYGDRIVHYENGVELNEITEGSWGSASGEQLNIGMTQNANIQSAPYYLDELRFFSKALSAQEVRDLYLSDL